MQDEIQALGDGLIMRHSRREDADRLAAFIVRIHSNGTESDSRALDAWTRDLLSGEHPTFDPGDFTVVEDHHSGEVVSCLNLISQTWSYAGIPFGVGRPELVGTLPEYRRRGLIRKQFEEIHRWSQKRGELVQGITGIPYYYRQFGYEMAINLGGGRYGSTGDVPSLGKDQAELFQIRLAEKKDIPFILQVMAWGDQRYPVASQWTPELMAYEISGKREFDVNRRQLLIIETLAGEPVGFFGHPAGQLWGSKLAASVYELAPGVSWLDVTPSVARYLLAAGRELAQSMGENCQGIQLALGEDHPAYQVFSHRLPGIHKPYAWYIRVPDLPAFLTRIGPALEKRLEKSACCGFSGEVRLGFYRSGVCLGFDRGRLVTVASLGATELDPIGAAFPGLTFLQLLFGYRSLDELRYAYPDCYADPDRVTPLLNALFPRATSNIWEIS